jgi:DNA-directed RNA polymerase specialized sigma24 family protein
MDEPNVTWKDDIPPNTLLDSLLPQISVMVRWACRRYHRFPDQGVIDDLTQEITLSLIQNDYHALRSFEYRSTEKTWLRKVVLRRVGRYFKSPGANGFCGHNLRPPIEEAIKRLCNQFW